MDLDLNLDLTESKSKFKSKKSKFWIFGFEKYTNQIQNLIQKIQILDFLDLDLDL